MRLNRANTCGDRSNALWGRGSRGEARSNALWGRGGRRAGVAVAVVAMFATASVAGAGVSGLAGGGTHGENLKSFVSDTLLSAIQQNPKQSFDVILQGDRKQKSSAIVEKLLLDKSGSSDDAVAPGQVKDQFTSISGAQLTLTGKQILRLAKTGLAQSIVPNETVKLSGNGNGGGGSKKSGSTTPSIDWASYNPQLWPYASTAAVDWFYGVTARPTIAIVDSGIEPGRMDFGARLLGQVDLASLTPNSPGDGYGHGTFVAGIAAGGAAGYYGSAPAANLLSIDVMNDAGQSTVADVINACDWILAHKTEYNIKVANFSLHAVNRASV